MKLIGIDYGRRRIGVAVTDPHGYGIRGLLTIDRKKKSDPIAELIAIIIREKAQGVVIGLPLDSNDNETLMSKEIRLFAAALEKHHPIPVYFIDESLSSRRATELLQFRKKKDRTSKTAVDRIAACLILEAYREEQECKLYDNTPSVHGSSL